MTEHSKQFDIARKLYPGCKLGNANEFKNFVFRSIYPVKPKCKYDINEVLPMLTSAIKQQIQWRTEAKGEFRPEWKNFQTWINDNYWEFEPPVTCVAPKMCYLCGGKPDRFDGYKPVCSFCKPIVPLKFKKYVPSVPAITDDTGAGSTPAPTKTAMGRVITPAQQIALTKFRGE